MINHFRDYFKMFSKKKVWSMHLRKIGSGNAFEENRVREVREKSKPKTASKKLLKRYNF